MKFRSKRGLSPVVATSLLVAITLILATIIFFWARSFISESIEKEGRAVEQSCEEADFLAEAHDGKLFVTNIGSVSIYAFQMSVEGPGEITEVGSSGDTVSPGQSRSFNLPEGVNLYDKIRVVPILLGETENARVSHICDPESYYVETIYQ